jgi:hypothetical protein
MNTKEQILDELRRSRAAIRRDMASVGEELNLVSKLQRSVKSRPLAWLGSAAALGYMLAGPKTRKAPAPSPSKNGPSNGKSARVSTQLPSFLRGVYQVSKFLLPLFRPAISAYVAQRLGDLALRVSR